MLRLVDANHNRAREGLRLLEDVARFVFDDSATSQKLKDLRHQLALTLSPLHTSLLTSRDSGHDVGSDMRPSADLGRPDLSALITANSRRVEESLRVLEEATRSPGCEAIDWKAFQKARFALYEIEKQLASRAMRAANRKLVKGLHLVLDTEWLNGRTEAEVAGQAVRGGAGMIQLRDKRRTMKELLPVAMELNRICEASGVLFVVNDYIDIALACGAGCLHLGQSDLPLDVARRLLPVDTLIGRSTHSIDQAVEASAQGADYIAVGAIYPTQSKHSVTIVGPDLLRRVRGKVSAPLVAIGGINCGNVAAVVHSGADAIAVISAVMAAHDVEKAVRELVDAIEESRKRRQDQEPHR